MRNLEDFEPPGDLDWQCWVDRWDRMQERYLAKRAERFATIVRLIRATQDSVEIVLDLGCGTGSLTASMLEAFPGAEVVGIDFDPTLLWLARARLARFGDRSRVVAADLRDESWTEKVPSSADAVVTATALHWLEPDPLAELYRRIARLMRPGAVFLNADHVGSDCARIQRAWESHRDGARLPPADSGSDDWSAFWNAYSRALGLEIAETHRRVMGGWQGGVEEGLPLAWHLDRLRESGFASVDCFWRSDCDAIYGGLRSPRLP